MKPKTRILLGFGVLVTIMLLALIGLRIYSLMNNLGPEKVEKLPSQIIEAKVLKGENFLVKTELFKLQKAGFWEIVAKGLTAQNEKEKHQITDSNSSKNYFGFSDIKSLNNEIIAVGRFGGYVFDLDGNFKHEFLFEPQQTKITVFGFEREHYYTAADNLRIIELAQDKYAVLSHGSVDGVNIYDLTGKTIWRIGNRTAEVLKNKTAEEEEKEVYVTEAATGDLDGDGLAEYIISQKADGIRVFDQQQQEKWFQPDEFPVADLMLVDIEGDGNTELLEFQGKSSTIRDKKTGNILRKLEIDGGRKILPTENAQTKKPIRFFEIDKNKLIISDLENKTISEFEAPLSEIKFETQSKKTNLPSSTPIYDSDNSNVRAMPVEEIYEKDNIRARSHHPIWVRLKKDEGPYLAVVASFIGIPRSNLYVYNEKGELIYHELLPEEAQTIAVLPNKTGNQSILVGGKDTIWKLETK